MNRSKRKRRQPSSSKNVKSSIAKNDLDKSTSKSSEQKQTGHKSGQVVLLDPTSSLSPEEKVFSIDHIVESILEKLDIQTLLSCRLVSRRWAYSASKALQNKVQIEFFRGVKSHPMDPRPFVFKSHGQPVANLVNLMNNSMEFPCNSFSIHNGSCASVISDFEPFFNAHGSHIRKLGFHKGNLSLDDLKSIIFNRALKLNELVLSYLMSDYDRRSSDTEEPPVKESRQRKASVNKTLAKPNEPVLKNLLIFKSSVCIPDTIIRQILESAPNLVEVILHCDNLHCLVQPTANRLHLVKKLIISNYDDDLNSLQQVVDNHQNNWAVEELVFDFGDFDEDDEDCENLKRQLLDIMGTILQCVSVTCTKLVSIAVLDNFQIPQMPQVKHVTFQYDENNDTGLPRNIFPEGVSLQDTFPNLKSLKIGSRYNMENIPIENIFGDDDPVPVPDVKNVTLQFPSIDKNLLGSFREMFPNATIQCQEDSSDDEEVDF